MSNFSDTFELPFTRVVNGKSHSVPILTTSDYLDWLVELTEARKADATRLLPPNMKPVDRHNAERAIALMECTPDDIRPLIAGGKGTIRVLRLAAKKIGITEEADVTAFVDGLPARRNTQDAYRASGLVSAEDFADWFVPKPRQSEVTSPPNASGPADSIGAQ